MGDGRDWTGSRLGSYYLDSHHWDLDEPGGQFYTAYHVDTGRPSLVFVSRPGDPGSPREDWSVRVISQSDPPLLATELEGPPRVGVTALTDVDLALLRMAGWRTYIENQKDQIEVFTQSPTRWTKRERMPPTPVCKHVRRGVLGAGLLVLATVALWPHSSNPPEGMETQSDVFQGESVSFIDSQDMMLPLLGYPMPDAPFEQQMKPPCSEEIYVEVKGGCWVLTRQDAPCPSGAAEYQGKCYVAVRKKKQEPRTIKQ